jgi:hypothetical protein
MKGENAAEHRVFKYLIEIATPISQIANSYKIKPAYVNAS